MPRTARSTESWTIYHVLNRGNGRMRIFRKAGDYEAFERVLAEGLERYPVELLSYCLMPNHWPRPIGTMPGSSHPLLPKLSISVMSPFLLQAGVVDQCERAV